MFAQSGYLIQRISQWVLLISLLIIALLSVAGRVLVAHVEYFRAELEQELAEYGIKGVSLDNLEGHIRGLYPVLKIRNASLSIPGRSQALSIRELEVSVKLIPSLISGDLKLESLHSRITKLILVRDRDNTWWLNDIPLNTPEASSSKLDLQQFFAQLPDFVNMDIGLIQIQDKRFDIDYLIQNGTLSGSRKRGQLSLQLLARLPHSLGQQLTVLLNSDGEKQQLYVKADQLKLKQLLQLGGVEGSQLVETDFSLQSWIDLENFSPLQMHNAVRFHRLRLGNRVDISKPLAFDLQQTVQFSKSGYRLDNRLQNIRLGAQRLANIHAQLDLSRQGAKPLLWVERLDTAALYQVFRNVIEDPALQQQLDAINLSVVLNNLVLAWNGNNPRLSDLRVDLQQWRSNAYQNIPGVSGINGSLRASQGRAILTINSQQAALDFSDLFRQPIQLDDLDARLAIKLYEKGVIVESEHWQLANSDLQAEGRLWLEAQPGGRPFMSLRGEYRQGRASATSAYLPVRIMPEKTVQWLDQSIRGGDLTRGDILFHGRLEKIKTLQQQQSGEFHALFDIENPRVRFLPDWPEVLQGQGKASFDNLGMELDFSKLHFAASEIDQVNVRIENFLQPRLSIHSTTESNADELLATLSAMPVLNTFDEVEKKTHRIAGRIRSDLRIELPLSKRVKGKLDVKARATLEQFSLNIPDYVVDLEGVDGVVEIHNEKVSASNLPVKYFGENSRLSIIGDQKNKRTQFRLEGDIATAQLMQALPAYLYKPVSGRSPWQVLVSLNHDISNKPRLEIKATSNLQGTQFSYPRPFSKAANEQQDIRFNGALYPNDRFDFKLVAEPDYQVRGKLDLNGQEPASIRALGVHFGGGQSRMPLSGMILDGKIDVLDLNQWSEYTQTYFSDTSIDAASLSQSIDQIDLDIDLLNIGSQQATSVKLDLHNTGERLAGRIESSVARGVLELPFKMGAESPLVADLDYLRLKKSMSDEKYRPDINHMPNLKIHSTAVAFGDLVFNDFNLMTRSETDRFVIKQLDLARDNVFLKSSGHWQYDRTNNEHVSVFNVAIKGDQFGQTVSNLGLGETIRNGKVDFDGQIGWGGELYNINWPSLIGEVNLSLEDGYLRNVEPGAGRFVGLLSFSALPKRLFLDFGDVLTQGMQFSKIKGKFTIDGELLKTENASMDSISAEVKIKGNTNLREQTYDQTMIIVPKVGDTLPVIGGLAAGNAVGWGLLLLQKLFKKPIEKSVEIEYKLSGSWDEPEVTLIRKPEQEDDIFENPNL